MNGFTSGTLNELKYCYLRFFKNNLAGAILNNKSLFVDDDLLEDRLLKIFCKDNPDLLVVDRKQTTLEKSETISAQKKYFMGYTKMQAKFFSY